MTPNNKQVVVVGAGLVGSLMSILLAKRGYKVDVYERRSDMRKADIDGGRSINLALSTRGWRALEKAGIKSKIEAIGLPLKQRMMHAIDGQLTAQAYGKEGEAIYSVSRATLNIELMDVADQYEESQFHFNKRCRKLDLRKNVLHFEDQVSREKSEATSPLIIGADGAFSAIRSTLQRTPRFNYSQHYLPHGYKELTIPPGPDGKHMMDIESLHIWPRGHFMMIALPNLDGSFTCTLFLPFEGEQSFENLNSNENVAAFFNRYFSDAVPLMPTLLEDFEENPTSSLVTIRCKPWNYKDSVLLMGDASHAIVPFYGQGMNSGFEDCTLLDNLIEEKNGVWQDIIHAFDDTRIKDADAIADLALRNFVEMRDLVGDPMFLLRKKIAAHFHKKYPKDFIPVYSMVTFSNIPYSEALAESKAQDQLFEKILALENIEENWKSSEVENIFKTWLSNKPSTLT